MELSGYAHGAIGLRIEARSYAVYGVSPMMRCAVLSYAMLLRACYAMCNTELGYAATQGGRVGRSLSLVAPYPIPVPHIHV
eukprot:1567216-Rhodomonas_salina.1